MSLADVFARFATSTYTRTPVTVGDDAGNYYEDTRTEQTPVTGVACRYLPAGSASFGAGGQQFIESPVLETFPDDPIKVGDLVSNVRSGDGVLLLEGPIPVVHIDPAAGFGVTFKLVCQLEGGETT